MDELHTAVSPRAATASEGPRRVVVGVSGSIAAYKAPFVVRLLRQAGHEVKVVATESALRFIGAPALAAVSGQAVSTGVFDDPAAVEHVAVAERAELVLVAPASADLLARVRAGRADDLLTATILTSQAPVVLAPAMHTQMWLNPATQDNVAVLRERGLTVIEPDSGRLTGKDSGVGRLPEPEQIVSEALAVLDRVPGTKDGARAGEYGGVLTGRHVVVSAGGTREPIDPVRYLGNRSSGRQGCALAVAAVEQGPGSRWYRRMSPQSCSRHCRRASPSSPPVPPTTCSTPCVRPPGTPTPSSWPQPSLTSGLSPWPLPRSRSRRLPGRVSTASLRCPSSSPPTRTYSPAW